LEGKELINVILAVIRYFGGIKLGAGGLTRAYGNTAKHVIEIAELVPYVALVDQQLTLNYKKMPLLEQVLKKLNGAIITQDFGINIRLTVQLPQQNLGALLDVFPIHTSH
jgi:putative IMPACT (imprinted ancient) family translation regulator